MKTKRKPLRPRDLGALALAVAGKVGGHHGDKRKETARTACRGKVVLP